MEATFRGRPTILLRAVDESLAYWVLFNVEDMRVEIASIANAMITETALPYWKSQLQLESQGARRTTLDELDDAFESFIGSGRQENVEMVRHQHERMKKICAFGPIGIESLDKHLANVLMNEQAAALPRS